MEIWFHSKSSVFDSPSEKRWKVNKIYLYVFWFNTLMQTYFSNFYADFYIRYNVIERFRFIFTVKWFNYCIVNHSVIIVVFRLNCYSKKSFFVHWSTVRKHDKYLYIIFLPLQFYFTVVYSVHSCLFLESWISCINISYITPTVYSICRSPVILNCNMSW